MSQLQLQQPENCTARWCVSPSRHAAQELGRHSEEGLGAAIAGAAPSAPPAGPAAPQPGQQQRIHPAGAQHSLSSSTHQRDTRT